MEHLRGWIQLSRKDLEKYLQHLSTSFYITPWGPNIVEQQEFLELYSVVSESTAAFSDISCRKIEEILRKTPKTLVVFRCIAGVSRDELGYTMKYTLRLPNSTSLFDHMELEGIAPANSVQAAALVLDKLISRQLYALDEVLPREDYRSIFDRYDTQEGWASVAQAASQQAYVQVLYQRYVGGFFRQVKDAYSEKKGDLLEAAVEKLLIDHGIPYHRTEKFEEIPGIKPAPDFVIPSKSNYEIVIEAKLAEDGGTARDKAARVKNLKAECDQKGYTLIAVIDGKGFLTRTNDTISSIIDDTEGRTFSLANLKDMLALPIIQKYIR